LHIAFIIFSLKNITKFCLNFESDFLEFSLQDKNRSFFCSYMTTTTHLLQNASHVPLALMGDKFFASLTKTCNDPLVVLRVMNDDLLTILRKLPPLPDDECVSGGINFNPTIMSPL
jgi:hypothetical protein